jgi:small-conductance mechanosensitive channel
VGAQSFFSNLISGVLLMVEKPLRIHDIVEVRGELAVVQEIGARATRVTTLDSTDIFLPNSSFWGNQIANQTYGSTSLKLSLALGVAYGSPEREVEGLLRQIAEAHPRILKTPAPYVRLAQFGETAMIFRLSFYLAQKDVVASPRLANDTLSDLRYAAVEALRQAGIDMVPTHRLELSRPPDPGA